MTECARCRRWCGGLGAGKSAALRAAVFEAMACAIRPIAYLPAVTDVGLRTERVDLPDADAARAMGAEELIGRLTRNLSSGERQRVRLALALTKATRYAVLDEPCRHLDPQYVAALNSVLETRTADGMRLATADVRGQLAAGLFQEEIGRTADSGPMPEPCAGCQGDPLSLEIPTPFLLSARGRPSGKAGLRIDRGALVVVRGPNGSGKTSLLEAMARAATASKLRFGISRQEPEHQVFAASPERELQQVSALRQGAPWCSRDAAPPHAFQQLIANLALEPWLGHATPRVPIGVLGLLGVAIALWMGHDLVLLDEPTQGLDSNTARALACELVRCTQAGARIVAASHDMELVRVANRLWTTDAGALATEAEA